MSIKIYENGAWRDTNTHKIYENGAWRDAKYMKVYENGTWVDKMTAPSIIPIGNLIFGKEYSRLKNWIPIGIYPPAYSNPLRSDILQYNMNGKGNFIRFGIYSDTLEYRNNIFARSESAMYLSGVYLKMHYTINCTATRGAKFYVNLGVGAQSCDSWLSSNSIVLESCINNGGEYHGSDYFGDVYNIAYTGVLLISLERFINEGTLTLTTPYYIYTGFSTELSNLYSSDHMDYVLTIHSMWFSDTTKQENVNLI
ncbi:hypothetical protein [Anaeromicropila herbilytica]|uniref:Uncharacterized protein n=1 Tax=Anaeromicropila herbilytica TaxID=2785025 RepID=A0A7R7IEF7_9FIRM|nr:hypothetical protein [Anaeromicropila herbilytica]BCN32059.1 hypothetical protein bsdtb5_33540 [Anaeromicropila herbilytica]